MAPASLGNPPYNLSYWHYHAKALLKLRDLRK